MPRNTPYRGHYCPECPTTVRTHSRSCVASRCTSHCTCTPLERRTYRAWVRGQQAVSCYQCGDRTYHMCEHINSVGLPTGNRVCVMCCTACNQHSHDYTYIPATCPTCAATTFGNTGRCVPCSRATLRQCRNCFGHVAALNHCGECGCCFDIGCNACKCPTRVRPRLRSFHVSMHLTEQPPTTRNPLLRSCGIELEVAGFVKPSRQALANLYTVCDKWNAGIGTDGSLRDPTAKNSSIEIRMQPASGDYLAAQVREIVGAVRAANGVVNRSCGLHVHVGARDMCYTLTTIKETWLAVQASMFKLVAPWRPQPTSRDEVFCAPNTRTSYGRYQALNFEAMSKYGTVEFRLHHGCLNTRAIVGWAALCGALVEWCSKNTLDSVSITNDTNARAFLYMIAPTKESIALLDYGWTHRWKRPQEHPIWQAEVA